MHDINETNDSNLKSWVESANDPKTDFPIQNLPFCAYRKPGHSTERIGVMLGNQVLELTPFCQDNELVEQHFDGPLQRIRQLNALTSFPAEFQGHLRRGLSQLFRGDASEKEQTAKYLVSVDEVEFELPWYTRDYTDFYCSIFHATNVGSMFRPDNPLLPNYKYVPIGYHGRASSIVISGTEIKRPYGQNRTDQEKPPVFIPAKSLDYEMELGFFVGQGNELGKPIPIEDAEKHIFGMCLVNDWSARDIQAWEYQPLGPFLSKNFATTISPFVVTMEALAPFRTKAFERDPDDPPPLDYLNDETNQKFGGLDINLEVYIETEKMRDEKIEPFLVSRSNTRDLYWTVGQMLTHHASNGCNMQTGDLIATGTVSGRAETERGCLLERTWRGTEPLELPSSETRRFLEDGDEVIMRGYCEREGFRRIGFGECRGRIIEADPSARV